MTDGEVIDYFNSRLSSSDLIAGTNYMIDADDVVHECVCWAFGGIWSVSHYNKRHPEYMVKRKSALFDRSTQFQLRDSGGI